MKVRRCDAPTTGALASHRNDAPASTKSALDEALERAAKEREARNRSGPPVGSVTRVGRVQDGDPNPNDLSEHARATLTQLASEREPARSGTGAPTPITPAASVNGPPATATAVSPYYKGGR